MTTTTMPREFYIPKNSTKVADKHSDAVAYVYERAGAPYAAVFVGKAAKPAQHYRHRDPAARERSVMAAFASYREGLAYKAKRRSEAAEKSAASRATVQVGDIYRTCWGYDQTNVEFFEVVEVKGAYAMLREVASANRDDGYGGEKCVPQSGAYLAPRFEGDDRGLPLRRLIQDGRIRIDGVRTGWPWGKRVAGVVVGEACDRTAAGWGH
jgi:hypothetical protein